MKKSLSNAKNHHGMTGRSGMFALVNMGDVLRLPLLEALGLALRLARRLWVVGGIGIVFEHLRDDTASNQKGSTRPLARRLCSFRRPRCPQT